MKRKIILNLAMSLDGYIVDEKGNFDWIVGDGDNTHNTKEVFKFDEFLENVDTLVMGRVSFEDCGVEGYLDKKIIVASSKQKNDYGNVKFIKDDICTYVQELQQQKGKDIWLFGGSALANSFIKVNIIDEFIIGIIPIILGSGRPLFLQSNPTIKLNLTECTVQEGITIIKYIKRT